MIRPRIELRRNAEIGAEEAAAKLGNEFLAGTFASIPGIAGKITADTAGRRRPVRCLVTERRIIARRVLKTLERWHLNQVGAGREEGLVSAMAD
ncbi:hypothetical protein FQZ97_923910 [compost metagenome]